MAIDFPNSPATNDTHTVGDKTWIYADGKWSTSTGVSTTNASLLTSGTLNNARLPVLTGYVSGSGTVTATDSILQAVQKLNGNTELKASTGKAIAMAIVFGS